MVELVDLALLGRQLRWTLVGSSPRPLHLQLYEFVAAWREPADTVAERTVAVGDRADRLGSLGARAPPGPASRLDSGASRYPPPRTGAATAVRPGAETTLQLETGFGRRHHGKGSIMQSWNLKAPPVSDKRGRRELCFARCPV